MSAAEVVMVPAHARDCPGAEFCAGECILPVGLRPLARLRSCGDPECADPAHALAVDPWCWPEEVAALLGVKVSTVTYKASETARWAREARQAVPVWRFPVPGRHRRRHVLTSGGFDRVKNSPQWRLSAVRAYQDAERPPTRRVPAGRPGAGRWAAKRRRVAS